MISCPSGTELYPERSSPSTSLEPQPGGHMASTKECVGKCPCGRDRGVD